MLLFQSVVYIGITLWLQQRKDLLKPRQRKSPAPKLAP
jgi:hypothetical protein